MLASRPGARYARWCDGGHRCRQTRAWPSLAMACVGIKCMSTPTSQVADAPGQGRTASGSPGSPSRLFVIVYYAVLAIFTAVVVVIAVTAGSSKHAQPAIAGGYDVTSRSACLGPTFDLAQSGRFVDVSNVAGTVG